MQIAETLQVPLTRGYFATIDKADEWIVQHKWYASVRAGGRVYAARSIPGGTILMHRAILGAAAEGLHVDHINGDGLFNRRANLRAVTATENHRNLKNAHANSRSGVMGVYLDKRSGRWWSEIRAGKARTFLGYFETIEAAKAARLAAERDQWGIQPRRAHLHIDTGDTAPSVAVARRNNRSGQTGVYFHTARQAWVAKISIGGRSQFLGRFATRDEAIAARLRAEGQRLA